MPIISKFDGGIVTGINDLYLTEGHSTVLTNVDIERISLLSYKDPYHIGSAANYFYEFPVSEEVDEGGEKVLKLLDPPEYFVTSANEHRSYAEFEGKLCYSNGGPQCRYTEGEYSTLATGSKEFKWLDMGVNAPDGKLIARPLVLSDIVGGSATLAAGGQGYLNAPKIRYRIVDTNGTDNVVYIHDIEDNPGDAVVEFKLPAGFKVYREIIDEYGEPTDQFALAGEGDFVDGGSDSYDKYNFLTIDNVQDYSSLRLSYVDDVIYSVPYTYTRSSDEVTLHVDAIYALDENQGLWTAEPYNLSVTEKGSSATASGLVWKGKLYVLVTVGGKSTLYDRDKKVILKGTNLSTEFHKCTTIEHNNILYMFSPSEGKVASFEIGGAVAGYTKKHAVTVKWDKGGIWSRPYYNKWIAWYNGKKKEGTGSAPMSVMFGSVEVKRNKTVQESKSENPCQPNCNRSVGYYSYTVETVAPITSHLIIKIQKIPVFSYARAADTVYTLHGDTIYALINDRAAARVISFNLVDFKVKNVGFQLVPLKKIVGLGGSSGCDFTQGDYQVFPVMGGVVTYSRGTKQTARWDNPKAGSTRKPKSFVFSNNYITLVAGSQLLRWKFSDKTVDYDLFDEKVMLGSYVYNVGQQTAGGVDGPVMLIETDPVDIHKGHMTIDLSGITHTNPLRLYRTGGHLTVFKMVEDIDPGTTYIDSKDDVTLALAREGEYTQAYAPPAGLKYLTAHRGMLFGAVGSKLFWSQPGAHENWDEVTNMKLMDRLVYGLVSAVNGLIIFMEGRIALLAGSLPLEFDMRTVTDDVGSVDVLGIKPVGTGAMFFSNKGLCLTDGIAVTDITYDVLGSIEFTTLASASTDRNYYAMVNNWTESPAPFVVLIYDITRQEPNFTTIDASLTEGLGIIDGKIAHTNKGLLYDTFGGSGDRMFHYKSGNINMATPTIVKEWDRVRITGDFVGKLIIYLDDHLTLTEEVSTEAGRINLHLPKGKNKSKAIKFELAGKGEVVSIEYSITDRKTTK